MSFREVMETYGSDKPDTRCLSVILLPLDLGMLTSLLLRYNMFLRDVTSVLANSRVKVLTTPLASGGRCASIKAINVKGMADLSKEAGEGIQKKARELGGQGVVEIRCGTAGQWRSPIEKHLTDQEKRALTEAMSLREGDLLLLCAGEDRDGVSLILGGIRYRRTYAPNGKQQHLTRPLVKTDRTVPS